MGRLMYLDPNIEAKFEDKEANFSSGLVIGSVVDDKYYGTFLAETPVEENEEETNVEGEEKKKSLDIDVDWMTMHSTQALKLLPGGMTILGFYFLNNPGVMTAQDGRIRKLISSVSQMDSSVPREMTVLLSKSEVKILDEKSSMFKAVDAKIAPKPIDYVILETKIILDIPVALDVLNNDLSKDTASGYSKFSKLFDSCIFLFNNKILNEKEVLGKPVDSEKKKKGKAVKSQSLDLSGEDVYEQEKIAVELLFEDIDLPEEAVTSDETKVRMKFAGRLSSRTYLAPGSSVKFAKDELKRDLLRSLKTRLDMHTNSVNEEESSEEEDKSIKVVHELPRRVYVHVEDTGVCISDYLFPGEGLEDCANNIKELFGWSVSEDCLEDDVELVASPREVRPGPGQGQVQGKGARAKRLSKAVLLSLGMAALSAGIAWMTLGSAEPDL